MTDVPEERPLTTPVEMPIEATEVTVLFHVPPVAGSLNVVMLPWQTVAVPVIGAIGFTVTVVAAMQPATVVYRMILVPEAIPVSVLTLTVEVAVQPAAVV